MRFVQKKKKNNVLEVSSICQVSEGSEETQEDDAEVGFRALSSPRVPGMEWDMNTSPPPRKI